MCIAEDEVEKNDSKKSATIGDGDGETKKGVV